MFLGALHLNITQGTLCFWSYWVFMNNDTLIDIWLLWFIGSLVGRIWLEGSLNIPLEHNSFWQSTEIVSYPQKRQNTSEEIFNRMGGLATAPHSTKLQRKNSDSNLEKLKFEKTVWGSCHRICYFLKTSRMFY